MVTDFDIAQGWVGNANPANGTVWRSYAPAVPSNIPVYTPQARAVPQSNISQRIHDLINGFDAPVASAAYSPSMNNNGAGRPLGSMVASPRSASVSTAVTDAYKTRTANQQTEKQSLSDWTKEFLANRPRAKQFANEETGAVSRFYGSGPDSVSGDLARIRGNRAASIRDLTEAAYRRASRDNSMRRAGGVNSSYLDRLFAQDLGRVGSEASVQNADQERADAMYLNNARTGLAGTRQQLVDQLISRNLQPAQVSSALEGSNLDHVGQIANLEYGNNEYQPAEAATTKRLQFLQYLMGLGLA